jgi:hypothetical protein
MELYLVAMLVLGVLMLVVAGNAMYSANNENARAQRLREQQRYEREIRERDNANILPNGVYTLRVVGRYNIPVDNTTMTVEMVDGSSVGGSASIVVHYAQSAGEVSTARVRLGSSDTETVGVITHIGSGFRIVRGFINAITLTPSSN